MAGTKDGDAMVSLSDILKFCFPKSSQHPLSTGRMFALALYGPLVDGHLVGGPRKMHVLQTFELDAMCRHFEREDILHVYLTPEQDIYTLTDEQIEEIIAQADKKMRLAKGRSMMPQLSKTEMVQLLKELSSGSDGLVSFHAFQDEVRKYRADRIERLKVVFPKPPPRRDTKCVLESQVRNRAAPLGRFVSADVAPRSMFLKDKGLTNIEVANWTNKLLSTRAYKICDFDSANEPSITANVRLLRGDPEPSNVRWNGAELLRGTNSHSQRHERMRRHERRFNHTSPDG